MPKLVVSVSNDLVTDQRVKKVCQTLKQEGYNILLIGRRLPKSLSIERPYKTYRINLLFNKKVWFYAEFNTRLFFKLLWTKADVYLANDLDTLLPNYLASKIKGKPLVYDSHELFTEVPELQHRPLIKKVWLSIERFIFPKLKNVITVNQTIADIYSNKYAVPVHVIRNISKKRPLETIDEAWADSIKQGRKMLILQGSGINKDRGAEEAVKMMQHLENVILVIIGGGDVFQTLKLMRSTLELEQKVLILDKMPYNQLMQYTQIADLGLSLDKGTNLNYEYALPNKVFDYIQCQVPLMVSDRKVVAKLVEGNDIGIVFKSYNPEEMAASVQDAFEQTQRYQQWKNNLKNAGETYHWEHEAETLRYIYKNLK